MKKFFICIYFLSMFVFMYLFNVYPLFMFVFSPYTFLFNSIGVILACTIYLPIMLFFVSFPHMFPSICVSTLCIYSHFVCLSPCVFLLHVCLFFYISSIFSFRMSPLFLCVSTLFDPSLYVFSFYLYPYSMLVSSLYIFSPCVSFFHI